MAWSAPRTWTTAELVTAAYMNAIRDQLLESPAAKATAAGQLFRATGAGSIEAFLPPAARAYHNSGQSIASGAGLVAVALNSERFDNAAMHDAATNNSRLTAPMDGVYVVAATLDMSAGGAGAYAAAIRLNGATRIAESVPSSSVTGPMFVLATIYKLAATDYVEAMVLQATGSAVTLGTQANYSPELAMAWIGPG